MMTHSSYMCMYKMRLIEWKPIDIWNELVHSCFFNQENQGRYQLSKDKNYLPYLVTTDIYTS